MLTARRLSTESDGDFDKAIEIIREKGQAIAAKRSDRETSNGCVLVKAAEGLRRNDRLEVRNRLRC